MSTFFLAKDEANSGAILSRSSPPGQTPPDGSLGRFLYFNMEDYESVLCVKNECFIYKIPPRTSNRGYRYVLRPLGMLFPLNGNNDGVIERFCGIL